MADEQGQQDGSQPERGTGQRQDHRAAPRGHRVPGEAANLADPEGARGTGSGSGGEDEESEESTSR